MTFAPLANAETRLAPTQVIRRLAGFEGRRQLNSPFLWLALLVSAALVWLAVQDEPATLWARSVTIAGSCLPIGITALLLANASALRDHSTRVGEAIDVLPTSRDLRTLGLVAGAWAPALLAVAIVLSGAILSISDDPAGSFNVAELAVGPIVVVLGQASGAALGRWIPHPLSAPLLLILVAALFLVQDFWPGERTIPAASPFLPWRKAYTDWVQAEPRMPIVHIVYLVGLIGLVSAAASRKWRAVVISGLVVVAAVLGLSQIEVAGDEVSAALVQWTDTQPRVCEEHAGVRFCAVEGYQTWVDDWLRVVERVQSLVPVELGVTEVQQAVNSLGVYNDTEQTVAYVHGRLPVDSDLTQQILAPELGMPGTAGEAAAMNHELPSCMASALPVFVSGEASALGYLVLTELAAPGSIRTGGFGGTYQFGHIEISEDEAELALRILALPEDEILSVLQPRWDQLTDPSITSAALAEWFDLEQPQVIPASSYENMDCICSGDGVSCTSRSQP